MRSRAQVMLAILPKTLDGSSAVPMVAPVVLSSTLLGGSRDAVMVNYEA